MWTQAVNQQTYSYMNASQTCHTHMGEAHCCCVVVSCGVCACVCGMWIIRERERERRQNSDAQAHVYMCTLAHSHTLYSVAWLIAASLGVLEEVQKTHFNFKKIFLFFILPVYSSGLIPAYCFFTIAVLASSSHHPRWRGSHRPHLDAVTNPTFPLIRWSRQTFSLVQTFVAAYLFAGFEQL